MERKCSHDAILPQLCPSLRSEQALVKDEQCFIDLKDVVVSVLNEILNDDVKLIRVREGKARLHEHFFRFVQRQLKRDSKGKRSGLGRFVKPVTADF